MPRGDYINQVKSGLEQEAAAISFQKAAERWENQLEYHYALQSVAAIDIYYQIRCAFQCVEDAAECMRLPASTIRSAISGRYWYKGLYWYHLDDPKKPRRYKQMIVFWNWQRFDSLDDAAAGLKITRRHLEGALKRGRFADLPISGYRPDPQKILEKITCNQNPIVIQCPP